MKIAYIFKTNMSSTSIKYNDITPQLEDNKHIVNVVDVLL